MRPNALYGHSKILFWHSKQCRISYFDIHNHILTFKLRKNMAYWHSQSYFDIRIKVKYQILTIKILFGHSNSAECCILTFNILFWHSEWGRISNFDIHNPIMTFDTKLDMVFWHQNPILTFELAQNIVFWRSKSDFNIWNEAEYRN